MNAPANSRRNTAWPKLFRGRAAATARRSSVGKVNLRGELDQVRISSNEGSTKGKKSSDLLRWLVGYCN